MRKGLSIPSIRPAYLIAVGVLLVLLTAGVFKAVGIFPESSSWSRATATAAAAADPSFQSALDASLRQSEERIEARLQRLLDGAGAAGVPYPNSDVSKLLAESPVGSSEYQELQRERYCSWYNTSDVPESSRIAWAPAPGKYILPVCDYGQISNRLDCLRWYMLLAALLNRTLVMPEQEGPPMRYAYSLVLDVAHARACINADATDSKTVVTLREYLESSEDGLWKNGKQVKKAVLDSVWCWWDSCLLDWYAKMLPGVAMPRKASGFEYRAKVTSLAELVRLFGSLPDAMISFGNVFHLERLAGVPPAAYAAPNLPLGRGPQTCRLLIQPHPALVLAAKGFAKTILGSRYMAVHLRRGDFHAFWGSDCHRKESEGSRDGCKIQSVAAIADCILEKLEGAGIHIVYVATDARPTELALLEGILRANPRGGAPVTVVRAPPALSQEDYFWARSWKQMKLDDVPLALATLDKLLCAMAKIFMGAYGSTFTNDIVTMRAGLGTLTCQDQAVCAVYADRRLPDFNITFTDSYQGTRHYRR